MHDVELEVVAEEDVEWPLEWRGRYTDPDPCPPDCPCLPFRDEDGVIRPFTRVTEEEEARWQKEYASSPRHCPPNCPCFPLRDKNGVLRNPFKEPAEDLRERTREEEIQSRPLPPRPSWLTEFDLSKL